MQRKASLHMVERFGGKWTGRCSITNQTDKSVRASQCCELFSAVPLAAKYETGGSTKGPCDLEPPHPQSAPSSTHRPRQSVLIVCGGRWCRFRLLPSGWSPGGQMFRDRPPLPRVVSLASFSWLILMPRREFLPIFLPPKLAQFSVNRLRHCNELR